MPRRAQDLTPLGIQKELKAFAASGKKTKALTDGKTPCLRLVLELLASMLGGLIKSKRPIRRMDLTLA